MSWFADTLIFDERYVNRSLAKHQVTKSTFYWNVGPRSFLKFLRTGSECMGAWTQLVNAHTNWSRIKNEFASCLFA